jgi:hypothetical protein
MIIPISIVNSSLSRNTLLGAAIKFGGSVYAISVIHLLGRNVYPCNIKDIVKEAHTTIYDKSYECEILTSNLIPSMKQSDNTWDTTGDFMCFRPKYLNIYDSNIPYLEDSLIPGSAVYIFNKNNHKILYYGNIYDDLDTHLLIKMRDTTLDLDNYSGSPIYGMNGRLVGLLSGADVLYKNNKNDLFLDCISSLKIKEYMSYLVK